MATVYGVVKGNIVVLPEHVALPDGQPVEVRIIGAEDSSTDDEQREDAFLQKLLDVGLLEEIKSPPRVPPVGDRSPISVKGIPLSQLIIEERR